MQVPKIDHEWYVLAFVAAGLARVALTMMAEIVDDAKVVYVKIRRFRQTDDISKLDPSAP